MFHPQITIAGTNKSYRNYMGLGGGGGGGKEVAMKPKYHS
jgi:hypothetical protein